MRGKSPLLSRKGPSLARQAHGRGPSADMAAEGNVFSYPHH